MTAVEGSHLSKTYPSRKNPVVALQDVSFSFPEGEIIGILGPNGAGKTTLIKCLCHLILPSSGQVTIFNIDLLKEPRKALQYLSAVLEGNRNVYWRLTAWENLRFFAALHGIDFRRVSQNAEALLDLFQLKEVKNREVRTFSRGMQQKLAVACALIKQTPLVFLDEPTLGMDVEAFYLMKRVIPQMAKELKKTLVITSHDMDLIQGICDRVLIIHHGRLIENRPMRELMHLFETSAYDVGLTGNISEDFQKEVSQQFPQTHKESLNGLLKLTVSFNHNSEFFAFMDFLKSQPVELKYLNKVEPKLEEIFLTILKRSVSKTTEYTEDP